MSEKDLREKARKVIKILKGRYPNARTALKFSNPLELLVATVLSAQCTDDRVNQVTRSLFKKYRSAQDYALADLKELEEDIRPTGFYRNKAKTLKALCSQLLERFNGEVPRDLDKLVSLKGIGRKTANLVLGEAFGVPGIVVDTHVLRLSQRIGLTQNRDPEKVEFDLMKILPKSQWTIFSNLLILHGRNLCTARSPKHGECPILHLCEEGMRWKELS